MAKLEWDKTGERIYETGLDQGVLYLPNVNGVYDTGVAWNGLTAINESPSGAEPNPQYADNIKYLNLLSAEEFGATIEAFTYPDAFAQCDGTALVNNVAVGQQSRRTFGLSYRTLIGNDILGTDFGYKRHFVFGATASPSEKSRSTVNDSPEATALSWDLTTQPTAVGTIGGVTYKPTAYLSVSSTKVPAASMAALEQIIHGTAATSPRLPKPAEIIGMFAGALTLATPVSPSYTAGTGALVVPNTTGVDYTINGEVVNGTTVTVPTASRRIVVATPKPGYNFPADIVTAWQFDRA